MIKEKPIIKFVAKRDFDKVTHKYKIDYNVLKILRNAKNSDVLAFKVTIREGKLTIVKMCILNEDNNENFMKIWRGEF